jgi:hypothetical protein
MAFSMESNHIGKKNDFHFKLINLFYETTITLFDSWLNHKLLPEKLLADYFHLRSPVQCFPFF